MLDIYVDEKATMDNTTLSQQAAEALTYLRKKVPAELHGPVVGITCGSGLSGLAESVLPEPRCEIPYTDIPHFPPSTGRANISERMQCESSADDQDSAWPCRQISLWSARAEQKAYCLDGR